MIYKQRSQNIKLLEADLVELDEEIQKVTEKLLSKSKQSSSSDNSTEEELNQTRAATTTERDESTYYPMTHEESSEKQNSSGSEETAAATKNVESTESTKHRENARIQPYEFPLTDIFDEIFNRKF